MDWNTSYNYPKEADVITVSAAMHLVNPNTYVSFGQWLRDLWQPMIELPMLFGLPPQNMTWLQGTKPIKPELPLVAMHYYSLISNIPPVRFDQLAKRILGPPKGTNSSSTFKNHAEPVQRSILIHRPGRCPPAIHSVLLLLRLTFSSNRRPLLPHRDASPI
jgi:hypothetical protein